MGLNVWCYTGFTYEQMLLNPKAKRLLEQIDVLVDDTSAKMKDEWAARSSFLAAIME